MVISLIVITLVLGITGCDKVNEDVIKSDKNESKDTIAINYDEIQEGDLQIVEWSYSAKEPSNPEKNSVSFMGDLTMGSIDSMSKKAVGIILKEGQALRIETEIVYPITVMLKDNSNEEYIFNKTSTPVEGAILVDAVEKDGEYELMVDFNEIDEFVFKVYIVNYN